MNDRAKAGTGARRRFDRAARGYEKAARLEAEVGARMLERLDYMRIDPRRILDAGAGTGRDARGLARRFPSATMVLMDSSPGMLRQAQASRGLVARILGRAPLAVCAPIERMPILQGAIDFAWSNLALHWIDDAGEALREFARVLRPEGLLMFSAYGPDTLRELGAASSQAFGASRVRRFMDMHDLGDLLVATGFADPVMDMERISLSYADARSFLADLRATAQTAGAQAATGRALTGRGRIAALGAALDAQQRDGRLEIGFEIVYGHAWKGTPRRTAEGHAIVRAPDAPRRARK